MLLSDSKSFFTIISNPLHFLSFKEQDCQFFKVSGFLLSVLIASLIIISGDVQASRAASTETGVGQQKKQKIIARGRILVSPKAGLPNHAFMNILKENSGKARKIGQSNLYIIDLPEYTEESAVASLKQNPFIKFAELDEMVYPTFSPNDPLFANQWHLAKINAEAAWDVAQGSGVTLAILDSGANPQHPDFAGILVPGWNFWDNNSDTTDLTGHGSMVIGSAVVASNNAVGIAALAPQTKIMPVRITTPDTGGAFYSDISKGIVYAIDHGASIANASFNNIVSSTIVQEAAQYMKNKNGLVVVAASNTGVQEYYTVTSAMIPVSATNASDLLANFSSYGNYVALSAPGENIWTTNKDGGYSSADGTSFASPIVAGVAALMMSVNPSLTNLDIEKLLFATAVDLGDRDRDIKFGYGRVNAAAAVLAAKNATPTSDRQAPSVSIIEPHTEAIISGIVPVDIQASDNLAVTSAELWVNGTSVAIDGSLPFAFAWDSTGVANGLVTLMVNVFDAAGNKGSHSIQVNVNNAPPPPIADVTPPTVKIVNPTAGNVSSNVIVTTDATDNSGANGITQSLYIDSRLVATGTGSTLAYTWNTRGKKGNHTIEVVAKDSSGNASSSSVIVKVTR